MIHNNKTLEKILSFATKRRKGRSFMILIQPEDSGHGLR